MVATAEETPVVAALVVEEATKHEATLEECPKCGHDMCLCPDEPEGEPSYVHSWNATKMIRPMNGDAHDHGHSVRNVEIR